MKEALAEKLLARVMGWTPEDVARERPDLQAIAVYKYDEYQQFSAGMRFVESLARWLDQFKTADEKTIAYRFVRQNLVYFSAKEMSHLVSIAYPDHVRPILLRRAAVDAGLNERYVSKVANSLAFKVYRRRCLFLGLSDGARIDIFRRANYELRNDQILLTYQVDAERSAELLRKLKQALSELSGQAVNDSLATFHTVVLLDDFCASGISYLRKESDHYEGKIARFFQSVSNSGNAASRLIDIRQTEILIVLYMATEAACQRLTTLCKDLGSGTGVRWTVIAVHPLFDQIRIRRGSGHTMQSLIETYYDDADETDSTRKGGADVKYGFASCGLPIVLHHNTPNNSIYLLWAELSEQIKPLFPRVSRHKADV